MNLPELKVCPDTIMADQAKKLGRELHPYHAARYVTTADCNLEPEDVAWGSTQVFAAEGRVIATMTDCEEQAPLAKLFAASPELFAALEELLQCPDLNLDNLEDATHQAIGKASAALTKAKGAA